jgi:hypothetical protein
LKVLQKLTGYFQCSWETMFLPGVNLLNRMPNMPGLMFEFKAALAAFYV